MRITPQTLADAGACTEGLDRFAVLFPEGVEVTEELCLRYADRFDFAWAAGRLLSRPACDAYHAAVMPASDAYHAAVKAANDAYRAARAVAFAQAANMEEV